MRSSLCQRTEGDICPALAAGHGAGAAQHLQRGEQVEFLRLLGCFLAAPDVHDGHSGAAGEARGVLGLPGPPVGRLRGRLFPAQRVPGDPVVADAVDRMRLAGSELDPVLTRLSSCF